MDQRGHFDRSLGLRSKTVKLSRVGDGSAEFNQYASTVQRINRKEPRLIPLENRSWHTPSRGSSEQDFLTSHYLDDTVGELQKNRKIGKLRQIYRYSEARSLKCFLEEARHVPKVSA